MFNLKPGDIEQIDLKRYWAFWCVMLVIGLTAGMALAADSQPPADKPMPPAGHKVGDKPPPPPPPPLRQLIEAKLGKQLTADQHTQIKDAMETRQATVSQYGITWTFDKKYPVGQFLTGDWWVVGPVTVTAISPAPEGGRHGSMVNPRPGLDPAAGEGQAYDDRIERYNAALLRKPPFSLKPNESLISTISILPPDLTNGVYLDLMGYDVVRQGGTWCATHVKSAAVLTCLAAPPPPNSFRPPYAGSTKTLHSADKLRTDLLPNVEPAPGAPALDKYARLFERPWIDHLGAASRSLHPAQNMPNYGREIATAVGEAGLLLCCNYPPEQKRPLLIGLIQVGLDNYGAVLANKHAWPSNGGHDIGRKFPILFAGLMLDNKEMLARDDYDVQEDIATYFGSDGKHLWTGWQNSGHKYAADVMYSFMRDTKEDEKGHPLDYEHLPPTKWNDPPFAGRNMFPWDKYEPYRRLVAAAIIGQGLAARMLGLKQAWNHGAFFAYCDRWVYENDEPNRKALADAATAGKWGGNSAPKDWYPFGGTASSKWMLAMYLKYRDACDDKSPPPKPQAGRK